MAKTDAELFSVAPKEAKPISRIDIVGQNGNEGLHYKSTHFALQTKFSFGWDYISTADDGLREVFKTKAEANLELLEIIAFTAEEATDYRVVSYNPYHDDSFARFTK